MKPITEIELEKIRLAILEVVSEEILDPKVDFSLHTSFIRDDIAIRLRGYIWGKQLGKHSVTYPEDWWQAFKERWFPKWVLGRYPVRYKIFEVDVKALYPDFKYSYPGMLLKVQICSEEHFCRYPIPDEDL